ncbi:DUF1767, partial [Teratosphaeria destructans]
VRRVPNLSLSSIHNLPPLWCTLNDGQRQRTGKAMAAGNANEIMASISTYLKSRHMPPSEAWLQSFLPSIKLSTPIVALQKTALFRILSTDLQISTQRTPASCFPVGITDAAVKERTIRGPVAVQVLDIEDIGRSRWSQFEAMDAQDRGETRRGQEVIRVVPEEQHQDSSAPLGPASSGPHKLLLQDVAGTRVFAMELFDIHGVNVNMPIGTKLVLQNFLVARGVILLEPRTVEVLGGKVDAWDKTWREERKQALKQKAGIREGAHINLLVPAGTLAHADEFYGKTLGLCPRAVPQMQRDSLRWFDIGDSGQQVHVAHGENDLKSSRHPCFRIESEDALLKLQKKIYEHYERGGHAAPMAADKPGEQNSDHLKALWEWSTQVDSSHAIMLVTDSNSAYEPGMEWLANLRKSKINPFLDVTINSNDYLP